MQSDKNLLASICDKHGWTLNASMPLSGGDINKVFRLETSEGDFVVKLNDRDRYPGMFAAEQQGLEALAHSGSFRIPQVIGPGVENSQAFLLLEFIEQGQPKKNFWSDFAYKLASLHRGTSDKFGFPESNYIGSLPQPNVCCQTASEFYITQRLQPQLKLAVDAGYSFSKMDTFFSNVQNAIPDEHPALIHGDLWNGNYMVDEGGSPVLIDPAVSFSIREMDLAMMRLFGGFHGSVYNEYNEIFPLEAGHEERVPLYQLYYLLVHLNLFGSGYLSQVRTILDRFS